MATRAREAALLASGGEDHQIRLWDAATYRSRLTLDGHTDAVNGVAFAPNDRHLAWYTRDSTIRVVAAEGGKEVHRLGKAQDDWDPKGEAHALAFGPDGQVLVSSQSPITDSMVRRFDASKVTGAQAFTYGNLPPVFDNIRNPGNSKTDLAMMKKFPIRGESKYFQLRLEAQNAFNQRGWGSYNTTIGDPHFGLIQSAGPYGPRIMQVSARLFF